MFLLILSFFISILILCINIANYVLVIKPIDILCEPDLSPFDEEDFITPVACNVLDKFPTTISVPPLIFNCKSDKIKIRINKNNNN